MNRGCSGLRSSARCSGGDAGSAENAAVESAAGQQQPPRRHRSTVRRRVSMSSLAGLHERQLTRFQAGVKPPGARYRASSSAARRSAAVGHPGHPERCQPSASKTKVVGSDRTPSSLASAGCSSMSTRSPRPGSIRVDRRRGREPGRPPGGRPRTARTSRRRSAERPEPAPVTPGRREQRRGGSSESVDAVAARRRTDAAAPVRPAAASDRHDSAEL